MSNVTVFDFGSQGIRFEQRGDRVWVCLTDMAKANGKQVNDFTRLSSTTEFIERYEKHTGIPVLSSNTDGVVSFKSTQEYLVKLQSIVGIPIISSQVGGDVSTTERYGNSHNGNFTRLSSTTEFIERYEKHMGFPIISTITEGIVSFLSKITDSPLEGRSFYTLLNYLV